MSRPVKPARLYLEPARKNAAGIVTHEPSWVIAYRGHKQRTGCGADNIVGAQAALAAYVGNLQVEGLRQPEKHRPAAQVTCAEVLMHYAEWKSEGPDAVKRPKELLSRIGALLDFWGDKTLADVTTSNCAKYTAFRSTQSAARRELEDFQAAIKKSLRSGFCRELVEVTLPGKPEARVDYFEREQVAAMIRHCYRFRALQTISRGPRKGEVVVTAKRPLIHLVPFILTAVYTASRSWRIWNASFEREVGRPWLDLDRGLFFRKYLGEKASKKRAATIRMPDRLVFYMRRWQQGPMVDGVRVPRKYLVEYNGRPADPKQAISKMMVDLFGEDHPYVRHTFRHTSVTWLMQEGIPLQDICDFASMSERVLKDVYGHFHKNTHRTVGRAFSTGRAGKAEQTPSRTNADETVVKQGEVVEKKKAEEPVE